MPVNEDDYWGQGREAPKGEVVVLHHQDLLVNEDKWFTTAPAAHHFRETRPVGDEFTHVRFSGVEVSFSRESKEKDNNQVKGN